MNNPPHNPPPAPPVHPSPGCGALLVLAITSVCVLTGGIGVALAGGSPLQVLAGLFVGLIAPPVGFVCTRLILTLDPGHL